MEHHETIIDKILARLVAGDSSKILRRVAGYGEAGCFPGDVSCEQLGRALFRVAMNAQEEDPFIGIIAGWRAAEREFHDRCQGRR